MEYPPQECFNGSRGIRRYERQMWWKRRKPTIIRTAIIIFLIALTALVFLSVRETAPQIIKILSKEGGWQTLIEILRKH